MHLVLHCGCWDWLAWCQYTVTCWDSKFDLQLLSQCGSTYTYLSKSIPEMHEHVALMISNHQATLADLMLQLTMISLGCTAPIHLCFRVARSFVYLVHHLTVVHLWCTFGHDEKSQLSSKEEKGNNCWCCNHIITGWLSQSSVCVCVLLKRIWATSLRNTCTYRNNLNNIFECNDQSWL